MSNAVDLNSPSTKREQSWGRSSDQQKALIRSVSRIRSSLDFEKICQTAVDEARQLLKADRTVIYRFKPDWTGAFQFESVADGWRSLLDFHQQNPDCSENVSGCSVDLLRSGANRTGKAADNAIADSYLQETQGGAFARGEIFRVCPDIYNAGFSECHIETLEAYQARAYTIAAIYLDRELWGLLAAYANSGPRDWQEPEVYTLLQIADQLGVAIKHAEHVATIENQSNQLKKTLAELRLSQSQLIQSEKMAALGQLVAGVAHEINNPLGAIQASANNTYRALSDSFEELPFLQEKLTPDEYRCFFQLLQCAKNSHPPITSRTNRAAKRHIATQLREAGIEEARSLAGLLMDMGVHEQLSEWLSLLQGQHGAWALTLAYNLTCSIQNNRAILNAVDRSSKIVFSLKNYAHFEQGSSPQAVNISDNIETVLSIYQNRLKYNIEVVRDYPEELLIQGYADELVQVWTNLIHNAIQAMETGGCLRLLAQVHPRDEQQGILVSVIDNGTGIEPHIQAKIFDAFYTTKPTGKGSGLGLHICKKIIDKHHGQIEVNSQPGLTEFHVWLPNNPHISEVDLTSAFEHRAS